MSPRQPTCGQTGPSLAQPSDLGTPKRLNYLHSRSPLKNGEGNETWAPEREAPPASASRRVTPSQYPG